MVNDQRRNLSTEQLQQSLSRLILFAHAKVVSGELKPAQARLVAGTYLKILHRAGLDEFEVNADSHTTRVVLQHANHLACLQLIQLLPQRQAEIERDLMFKGGQARG